MLWFSFLVNYAEAMMVWYIMRRYTIGLRHHNVPPQCPALFGKRRNTGMLVFMLVVMLFFSYCSQFIVKIICHYGETLLMRDMAKQSYDTVNLGYGLVTLI